MTFRDRDVLNYRPFQGDETDVTQLADRFVVTRYAHACTLCWEEIPPRARVRALTEINNEEHRVKTFYFCAPCCAAMAKSWRDHGRAIEHRYGIGQAAARAKYRRGAA